MKHKCPSPRIGKKPRGNIGRWLYAAFLTATLSASLCQPASAATVWEKANEIMRDVYTQILGISTIAAIVTCKKTAHDSVFTKWKGTSRWLLQKPLGSVMYSAF